MTEEEIRQALLEASGRHAYVDAGDEGTFILDGAFTLQQLVAIGDVARKALDRRGLSGALTEAVEQFGAERLANALVEPKVGDTIRVVKGERPYYCAGDYGKLVRDASFAWEADFNDDRNGHVDGDGIYFINANQFEVVR